MSGPDFSGKTVESISEFDRRVYESLSKGQWLPNAFKQYFVEYLALNQPLVPIGQVVGFSQYAAQFAAVRAGAEESTVSTAYTDLATVGPSLTGLSDGRYLLIYGGSSRNSATNTSAISPSVNGAAASDDNFARTAHATYTSVARAITATLQAGGNNSVTIKYRTTAGTGFFAETWLIALRYANI